MNKDQRSLLVSHIDYVKDVLNQKLKKGKRKFIDQDLLVSLCFIINSFEEELGKLDGLEQMTSFLSGLVLNDKVKELEQRIDELESHHLPHY